MYMYICIYTCITYKRVYIYIHMYMCIRVPQRACPWLKRQVAKAETSSALRQTSMPQSFCTRSLSLSPSLNLSLCLCLSVSFSLCLSVSFSLPLSLPPSVPRSLALSLCLSLSVCLSLSLLFLSLSLFSLSSLSVPLSFYLSASLWFEGLGGYTAHSWCRACNAVLSRCLQHAVASGEGHAPNPKVLQDGRLDPEPLRLSPNPSMQVGEPISSRPASQDWRSELSTQAGRL